MSNEDEQLALVAAKRPRARTHAASPLAERDPVAQVLVDVSLPHLDRLFDYAIPSKFDDAAVPGARVRVRFAGRLVDGYLIQRSSASTFTGKLAPITSVASAESVLTPELLEVCREVAERGACSLIDVVRSAVPPRHARAEAAETLTFEPPRRVSVDAWSAYHGGASFISRIGDPVRAVWTQIPGDWAAVVAAIATARGGVIVVVPNRRVLETFVRACEAALGVNTFVTLSAELGPAERYRAFTAILRGSARIVIGTRGAVFAPVRDLSLIMVLDDVDDALVEPHAPYWNARDVAAIRSHQVGCTLLVGGLTRSIDAQGWLERGWAKPLTPLRSVLREHIPKVHATSEFDLARDEAAQSARIPHRAWTVARDALRDGPVLVQVPRRGYAMGLSCAKCRTKAACACGGALASDGDVVSCTVCTQVAHGWHCGSCGSAQFRAAVIGNERTAEELGRAFPGVRVVMSDASHPVHEIEHAPAIVVSTPGLEPAVSGGYSAVLILDAASSLQRAGLHAAEQTLARWFDAAACASPGRSVVVTADASLPQVQALIRWDPAWYAATEYAERVAAGLPPVTRVIAVTGSDDAVRDVVANVPPSFSRLGPVLTQDGRARISLIGPRSASHEAAKALHAALGARSVKSTGDLPNIRMDAELG